MENFAPLPWPDVFGRLLLAVALSTLIGFDREYRGKAAGLRTNMLVALGTALIVLVQIQSGLAQAEPTTLARVIQGTIAGVGFVGAGTIFQGDRVRGLTTAAAVWVSAGLGIVAGLGEWQMGLMGVGMALVILTGMKWLEKNVS